MRDTLLTFSCFLYTCFLLAQFGPQQVISSTTTGAYLSQPVDIDNDGDMDVLKADLGNHFLYWHKNIDGEGNFGSEILISSSPTLYLFLDFQDIDSDGDKDLLYRKNNPSKVGWLENLDGIGTFNSPQIILNGGANFIKAIHIVDIDNDSDLDLIAGYSDSFNYWISWYENIDGMGTLSSEQYLFEYFPLDTEPKIIDLDHDGQLDILVANHDEGPAKLSWYKNLGNVSYGPEQIIYQFDYFNTGWTSINRIYITDITTDGMEDIVILSGNDDGFEYWFFENLDNEGNYGEIELLFNNFLEIPLEINFCDIDNDGDIDIIRGNSYNNRLYWVENSDGLGTFTTERNITTEIQFLRDFRSADFNNDGLLDVVSASIQDNKVAWYENTGILGFSEKEQPVITIFPNPVDDIIYLETDNEIESITLFNSVGAKILTVSNSSQIDVEQLPQGIYLLKILFSDGRFSSEKIIKF